MKKGKITSVKYRANVPVGQYQHVHLEAESSVGVGETEQDALMRCIGFVEGNLDEAQLTTLRTTGLQPRPSSMKLSELQRDHLKTAFNLCFHTGDVGIFRRRWERFETELKNRRLL
jgi:hypothetical protein